MSDSLPTLWHIEISHYSEKARWALAYKGVEHRRRAPLPGAHIPVALFLTRGAHKTFPIVQLDGRTVGDSTAVIAALEERFPEPPLYPADAEQRRRALELEDFFDEELGPHVRLLGFHELRNDPDAIQDADRKDRAGAARQGRRPRSRLRSHLLQPALRRRRPAGGRSWPAPRSSPPSTASKRSSTVTSTWSAIASRVADLTAAALLNPIVLPDEGPIPNDTPGARGIEEFRAPLVDRDGFKWVEEMFARHRLPAPAAAPA